jgi:predicted nucleic acid-binding protein
VYLDTDVILAVIKRDDWLKRYVNLKRIHHPKTSVLTIVEAELVLIREVSREAAISCLKEVKEKGITLLPIGQEILKISSDFLEKYPRLNLFDSIHAAFSFKLKEEILSTDSIFDGVSEIKKRDPRNF